MRARGQRRRTQMEVVILLQWHLRLRQLVSLALRHLLRHKGRTSLDEYSPARMSIDHGCHGVLSVACILRTVVDTACTVTWSAFVNVPKPVYPTDARLVHGWVATAAGLSSRTNRCIFDRPLVVVAVTLVLLPVAVMVVRRGGWSFEACWMRAIVRSFSARHPSVKAYRKTLGKAQGSFKMPRRAARQSFGGCTSGR